MSTYYYLHCADHDVRTPHLGNRADNDIRLAVALWPDIVALRNKCEALGKRYDAMPDLELRTSYLIQWHDFEPFMLEHGDHNLQLFDEYGKQAPLLDDAQHPPEQ